VLHIVLWHPKLTTLAVGLPSALLALLIRERDPLPVRMRLPLSVSEVILIVGVVLV